MIALVARLEAAEAQVAALTTRLQAEEEMRRDATAAVVALTQERDLLREALDLSNSTAAHRAEEMRKQKSRAEAAEAALADTRKALEQVLSVPLSHPDTYRDIARRALAATGGGTGQEQQP